MEDALNVKQEKWSSTNNVFSGHGWYAAALGHALFAAIALGESVTSACLATIRTDHDIFIVNSSLFTFWCFF